MSWSACCPMHIRLPYEGRCKATWKREFKLPWREDATCTSACQLPPQKSIVNPQVNSPPKNKSSTQKSVRRKVNRTVNRKGVNRKVTGSTEKFRGQPKAAKSTTTDAMHRNGVFSGTGVFEMVSVQGRDAQTSFTSQTSLLSGVFRFFWIRTKSRPNRNQNSPLRKLALLE